MNFNSESNEFITPSPPSNISIDTPTTDENQYDSGYKQDTESDGDSSNRKLLICPFGKYGCDYMDHDPNSLQFHLSKYINKHNELLLSYIQLLEKENQELKDENLNIKNNLNTQRFHNIIRK